MDVITAELIQRLSKPGPRYTSYPTAPEWKTWENPDAYNQALKQFGNSNKTVSVYIHIPFCASMCYYCGCNVVIRKSKNNVGDEYLDYLEKEMQLVSNQIGRKPHIKQLHLGGGTPNFLSSDQFKRLVSLINRFFSLDTDAELAIEVDPRTIELSQVETLKTLGFNRISMGIQDFSSTVQQAVNRIQPYEQVKLLIDKITELHFQSVNMDLIYGLPHQTEAHIVETIEKVLRLSPDRIALYSFAYVPWLKSHQKLLVKDAIPTGKDKLDLFLKARSMLLANGYSAIGMDHFAKHSDDMAKAYHNKTLHRNFMGYTLKPADEYLGFGVSSIGFISNTFSQNNHDLNAYYTALDNNEIPSVKGLVLSKDDSIRQWVINQLMCQFELDKKACERHFDIVFDTYFSDELTQLDACKAENLVEITDTQILVTELGRFFVRNVAMVFDAYLTAKLSEKRFSSTI